MNRAIALVVVVVLAGLVGWPLLAAGLAGGEGGGGTLLDSAVWADDLGAASGPAAQTIRVVLAAEALAMGLGLPLALLLFKTDAAGRAWLIGTLGLALFVPMPLYATGWIGGFGNAGRLQAFGDRPILAGWAGAAFVHGMASVPWVALIVGAGLRAVEPELEESAWTDRPAWWVLLHISLRRALGSIAGAALAVAVLTAGDMTVTDLLRVRTYAEDSYVQFGLGRSAAQAAWAAAPPTLMLGLLIALGAAAIGRVEPSRIASARSRAWSWPLGPAQWLAGAGAAGVVALLAGPPIYALVWRAGRLGGLGGQARWSMGSLIRTLSAVVDEIAGPLAASSLTAASGALLAVALAWAAAWACRSLDSRRFQGLIVAATALTLALPGPVAGLALKMAYLRVPAVHDTPAIVVLGLVMRTWPFAFLVVWPGVAGLPAAFLESASVDGYGPPGVIGRVALPLTAWSIAAAWGVAFVLGLGELPVTNLVTPPGFDAVSTLLWQRLHFGVDSELAGIGLVLLLVYGALGLGAAWLLGRALRLERIDG